MRQTKIVATIGPASREPEVLERMVAAGIDVARLNFAHAGPEEHAQTAESDPAAAERAPAAHIAILGDVPGPKLRLGPVEGGVTELGVGTRVVLTPDAVEGDLRAPAGRLGGPGRAGRPGRRLLPGRRRDPPAGRRGRRARRWSRTSRWPGAVASRQGINLPNVTVSLPGRQRAGPPPDRRRARDGRGRLRPLLRAPARGPRAGARAPAARAAATCRCSRRSRSRRRRPTPRRSSMPPTA